MAPLIECTLLIAVCYAVNPGSVRADDVRQHLAAIDRQRNGLQTDTESLEKKCLALLNQYTAAPDRGRIYAQIALIYAQAGLKDPDKTAAYCKRALEYPLDTTTGVQMYMFWADALQVKSAGVSKEDFVVARIEMVTKSLRGLKLILQENPPKEVQPVPAVDRFDCTGLDDDPICRELAQKKKEQIAARERIMLHNTLVHDRTSLTEKIVELNAHDPVDIDGLRALAWRVLEDKETVEELGQRVQRRIEARPRPTDKSGAKDPARPD